MFFSMDVVTIGLFAKRYLFYFFQVLNTPMSYLRKALTAVSRLSRAVTSKSNKSVSLLQRSSSIVSSKVASKASVAKYCSIVEIKHVSIDNKGYCEKLIMTSLFQN
jgi:hypothetical protein